MNRLFTRLYPSPSFVVSITALVVALGSAGYSATGGNFILGQANSASTQTALSASLNGRALQLTNTNTGGSAAALGLNVAAGHPPLAVNSAVKVANLNADKLDGLDSTQFPRTSVVSFNLAPGADSAPIALPANRPVLVMGVTTTTGYQGVGQVTLLRAPGQFIEWTGLDSPISSGIASGFSPAPGYHIVYIDFNHKVDIQVDSPDTLRVHNASPTYTHTGNLTLIW
jgi:hypothetical protein